MRDEKPASRVSGHAPVTDAIGSASRRHGDEVLGQRRVLGRVNFRQVRGGMFGKITFYAWGDEWADDGLRAMRRSTPEDDT